jgi:hypothetical protein
MRLISSIVENALKVQGIEVEYDDLHPGVYTMKGTQVYGSEDELTTERMIDIGFAALSKVKAKLGGATTLANVTGRMTLDQALTEVEQEYIVLPIRNHT